MDAILRILRDDLGIASLVDGDTPLISSGVIDSFHVAALLAALEAHYKVRIEPAEIGVDNFDTAGQMHAYIQQRAG
jgi:acyl carrier protein